jgi:hypothetical protein
VRIVSQTPPNWKAGSAGWPPGFRAAAGVKRAARGIGWHAGQGRISFALSWEPRSQVEYRSQHSYQYRDVRQKIARGGTRKVSLIADIGPKAWVGQHQTGSDGVPRSGCNGVRASRVPRKPAPPVIGYSPGARMAGNAATSRSPGWYRPRDGIRSPRSRWRLPVEQSSRCGKSTAMSSCRWSGTPASGWPRRKVRKPPAQVSRLAVVESICTLGYWHRLRPNTSCARVAAGWCGNRMSRVLIGSINNSTPVAA